MKKSTRRPIGLPWLVLLLVGVYLSLVGQLPPAWGATWATGDVFVGISSGSYEVYDNAGTFKETISDGLGGYTTGCAFNPALDKLYTTNFSNTKVKVYDDVHPHTILQTIDTAVASPGGDSESIVFDAAGNFYVGHPDGNKDIHKYDSAGTLLATYSVATENRGSDWVDLAADQQTMFYTSEGGRIMRYDVANNAQLSDFANIGGISYALRLLPPGDGSGGLIVANTGDIKRLGGLGQVVQTYDATGENCWFSMNLDPNGTSFWAGDFCSSNFYRFNISTGAIELGPINTGTSFYTVFGICLKGEPTAAIPPEEDTRRMTGGGSVFQGSSRVTHGFELNCDASQGPNNLQVNWGRGNRFHLESLSSAACSDDPNIGESPPVAGFDTYVGSGTGRYNGVSGATATWTFTDAGEPGNNDLAEIQITDASGNIVKSVSGNLDRGNHQAHAE